MQIASGGGPGGKMVNAATGALVKSNGSSTTTYPWMYANGSETYWQIVTLDASKSSSVYGSSGTVQPPSLTTRYYIKF